MQPEIGQQGKIGCWTCSENRGTTTVDSDEYHADQKSRRLDHLMALDLNNVDN
jgi:hypothetical protein